MSFSHTAPLYSGNGKAKGKGAAILNSKCAKYSSISMFLNNSKTTVNPSRLSRELQRIEPRVKTLENDAFSLRNLVPFGLKDMIDQTKNDIISLQAFYSDLIEKSVQKSQNEESLNESSNEQSNNDIEQNDSGKIDIDEELSELQKRVLLRLNSSLETTLKMINNENEKMKQEAGKSTKIKSINMKIFDTEEDYLEEIQQRIASSSEFINERNSRTKDRIKVIQNKISKLHDQFFLGTKNDNEIIVQKLSLIEEDCKNHRSEISDLKDRITNLRQSLLSNTKFRIAPKIALPNNDINNENIESISSTNSVDLSPDLPSKFQELKDEAANLKKEFEKSINTLKKEADECEKESQELTNTITSISTSTETIETNAKNASKLTHELQDKLKNLSSKIEQQEYSKSLMSIVEQIKSTNDKISKEIQEIKKKINISDTTNIDEEDNENQNEIENDS